jgi:hypothetical protein
MFATARRDCDFSMSCPFFASRKQAADRTVYRTLFRSRGFLFFGGFDRDHILTAACQDRAQAGNDTVSFTDVVRSRDADIAVASVPAA